MGLAEAVLGAAAVWAGIGLGVALLFLSLAVGRIDPQAAGAYVFRVLLIPGIVLLWPLVLWRWWSLASGRAPHGSPYDPPRRWQRRFEIGLGVLAPLVLVAGLLIRQADPINRAPVQIAPASEQAAP